MKVNFFCRIRASHGDVREIDIPHPVALGDLRSLRSKAPRSFLGTMRAWTTTPMAARGQREISRLSEKVREPDETKIEKIAVT